MKLKHVFVVVLVAVALVLGLAVVSGFQLYGEAVRDSERASLDRSADVTAAQLNGLLDERIRTVELQARDPDVLGEEQRQRDELRRFIETTQYQGISVIDADGRMIGIESAGLSEAARENLLGQDFSDREYFQAAIAGDVHISEPVEAETGNFIVTVSVPIEEDGAIVATLNAALHLQDGALFDAVAPDPDTELAIQIDSETATLYQSGPWSPEDHRTATATVERTGWELTAAQPDTASEQTRSVTLLQGGAVGLVLASLVGFSLWYRRTNLRQIDELLDGFDRLAQREYGTTIAVSGAEEWETIGKRFNEVSNQLAVHARELEQYEEIVERIDDPIALTDHDGNHVLVNQATADVTGVPKSELLGANECEHVDEESCKKIASMRNRTLETEQPQQYELSPTFERTERSPTYSTRRYPFYDDDGELAGTLVIRRDVTDLTERETELRQYKRAVTAANDLICALDCNREFLFANQQYCRYHGVDPEEVVGRQAREVFDKKYCEEIEEYTSRALDGESSQYQTTRTHPELGERILDTRYHPIRDGEEIIGIVAVLRDVTEREEQAKQIRVVDRILRHNLRNDLTVISLEAERIASIGDREIAAAAEDILNHADGLLTTSQKSRRITELLSERPEPEPTNLSELTASAADELERKHPETTITTEIAGEVTAMASPYTGEAVAELLRNAIQHNDSAEPMVELSVETDGNTAMLRVSDNGPGLSEMDRTVLETGKEAEDLYHGSGLGLWFVYWAVRHSGGTVTVDSREPRGTDISIMLPKHDSAVEISGSDPASIAEDFSADTD